MANPHALIACALLVWAGLGGYSKTADASVYLTLSTPLVSVAILPVPYLGGVF